MLLRAMISLFMFPYHHLQNLPHCKFTNSNTVPKTRQNFICITIELIILTKHSLSVKGVDVRNNLDVSLTKITSLPIFKKKSKIHFMRCGPTNYCPGLPETARGLPETLPETARVNVTLLIT
jgi:hypothetical protein